MMRIAIADDDPELLEQLSTALDGTSHQYEKFRSGTDLQTSLKRETYVWTAGQDGWKPAEDVAELAQLFTILPPPPPPGV